MPNALHPTSRPRARDHGLQIGVLPPGPHNAIVDVPGVKVGHCTLHQADNIRTGVTAILPASGNLFQRKVPAAVDVINGFGKLAGITQIQELGQLESPILLTNTLSVAPAIEAIVQYTLTQPGNERVTSVNAVVGETNDGILNDIRARHITIQHALQAIQNASADNTAEGSVSAAEGCVSAAEGCIGAGTGTICFGFKGGIGTASRVLPPSLGGYTVGAIVQTNFGGVLAIDGVPIGQALRKFSFSDKLLNNVDGSCMIVLATDAPLDARNLHRLAQRAAFALARTGGIASNGSGDYAIAFSTAESSRIDHAPQSPVQSIPTLHNDAVSPLFLAAIESTEEAIVNSLFTANTTTANGTTVPALPLESVLPLLREHHRIRA